MKRWRIGWSNVRPPIRTEQPFSPAQAGSATGSSGNALKPSAQGCKNAESDPATSLRFIFRTRPSF